MCLSWSFSAPKLHGNCKWSYCPPYTFSRRRQLARKLFITGLLTSTLTPCVSCTTFLTHWGRDEIDAITQTTFSSAFFLKENVWIPTKISLKFVPKGPISNIPALVQIMAWRRSGDKPLSEPMMVSLLTHICVTRPQWVNALYGCLVLRICWRTDGWKCYQPVVSETRNNSLYTFQFVTVWDIFFICFHLVSILFLHSLLCTCSVRIWGQNFIFECTGRGPDNVSP